MNIIDRIASHNFAASEEEVQQLAQQVVAGRSADSTYLKVLVVATQSERKRREPIATFENVAERLYKAVLMGVGGPDTPNAEINRRATFARTSASALRKWIMSGGDIKTLDPHTVTKRSLAPARPQFFGDRVQRSIQAHTAALLETAQKLEAKDPLRAATMLTDLIAQFQAELDHLEEEHVAPPPARVTSSRHLERVLHSSAQLP
jgi:hypothetical protein